jgi:hypothetical protein
MLIRVTRLSMKRFFETQGHPGFIEIGLIVEPTAKPLLSLITINKVSFDFRRNYSATSCTGRFESRTVGSLTLGSQTFITGVFR